LIKNIDLNRATGLTEQNENVHVIFAHMTYIIKLQLYYHIYPF